MAKNSFEKIAKAPAEALEAGLEETKKIGLKKPFRFAEDYWHKLGPGLVTGAADDDPSGIATYSQAGAQYGFQLLWTSLLTFPLMGVVQEMCARIGLVTGKGLAANLRDHYPKWVISICTVFLFASNTFNLGADLGAMAQATQLLAPQMSFALLVIFFAIVSLLLQVFTSYQRYARYLKFLALILFSYVLSALLIQLDWKSILTHTVVPSITFSKDQIFLLCAILGTTISPYLFFWQTSQEVEEGRLKSTENAALEKHPNEQDLRSMRIDVWSGMFVSNVVMFFIIVACGAMLYTHGITNITSAAEAAEALRPLAGESSFLLFALGIVGTGLLSVPVLAGSASYALSESNGWTTGLNKKLKKAYAFYGVIIISMFLGLLMNFVGIDPIKMLIYSAVANGLIAPVILLLIVKMSSSKIVMGKHANGPVTAAIGWITTIVLFLVSGATVISFLL